MPGKRVSVTVIMISRDIVVDVMRLLAVEQGKVVAANVFGKIKTVTQMIALIFVLLNNFPFSKLPFNFPFALILCYVAMGASLLSGIIYVIQNIDLLKDTK